jgi:hypothetical protein
MRIDRRHAAVPAMVAGELSTFTRNVLLEAERKDA